MWRNELFCRRMLFKNLTRRNEIGANCYYLKFGETEIAIDSGMHPKEDGLDSLPDFEALPRDTLDAIFVSHAHLDHVGSLPVLMRHQPAAPVYMTEATGALADAMLHNSVNVMTSQREELGITDYPFFTHRELDRLMYGWEYRGLEKPFPVGNGDLAVEFFDAGHIVGSVGILFRHRGRSVFYTGDVNFEDQTISMGADFPEEGIDTLIIETTRGAVERNPAYSRADEESQLATEITRALEQGGSVLIPLFAMGKTQEILIMLDQLKSKGMIPDAPVFIGGLSTKMTTIFDKFSSRTRRNFRGFQILKEMDLKLSPRKKKHSIQYSPGCIYALSSGMMTEKTVSNQFGFQFLDDHKNSLLFVGYADPQSPAGKIRDASPGDSITLDPEMSPVELHCHVQSFDFSGHSSRKDLRAYINRVRPKKVFLVHGDRDALDWFHTGVCQDLPDTEVVIPSPGKEFTL